MKRIILTIALGYSCVIAPLLANEGLQNPIGVFIDLITELEEIRNYELVYSEEILPIAANEMSEVAQSEYHIIWQNKKYYVNAKFSSIKNDEEYISEREWAYDGDSFQSFMSRYNSLHLSKHPPKEKSILYPKPLKSNPLSLVFRFLPIRGEVDLQGFLATKEDLLFLLEPNEDKTIDFKEKANLKIITITYLNNEPPRGYRYSITLENTKDTYRIKQWSLHHSRGIRTNHEFVYNETDADNMVAVYLPKEIKKSMELNGQLTSKSIIIVDQKRSAINYSSDLPIERFMIDSTKASKITDEGLKIDIR